MQKVLWSKGLLLAPQHMQLQDRYLESLVDVRLGGLATYPWGVRRLEIDREALAGGTLALAAAAGILPDGLAFDLPAADPAPPPRPLEPVWRAGNDARTVYLALPELRPGGRNVSMGEGAGGSRYAAEVVVRRDENTGADEKPLQLSRKSFRLLLEGESLEGSASLPVARVLRDATGGFSLDPRFVPPLLDFAASEYLLALARRLVEILSARSAALSGMRRQRNQGLADFGVSDVANFWLLYTVNTHLPTFRHLYETRRGHPEALFEAMLEMAGALTTFSSTVHPRDLPVYDHAAPAAPFERLDALLRELLETVVPARHVTLPLQPREGRVHVTALDQDRYLAATEMYLAVRAGGKQDELMRRIPQLAKLSSADELDRLIRLALPGLGLRHVPVAPAGLPIRLDYQYFQVERAGPEWEAVRRARNLAAYVPSDFVDPSLELVILLPAER